MTLPQGWANCRLQDVTSKIGSGATPRGGRDSYGRGQIPLIRSMNVRFTGFDDEGLALIDEEQACALDNVTVRSGDVLLNITGASIGRVCLAPDRMDGARVNQHVCIIRPEYALPVYVGKFLSSPRIQSFILDENYGLTRQALTKGMVEQISLPLPPVAEQRRIVAKLDALIARLARARAELDRVPVMASKLRRGVLTELFALTDEQAGCTTTAELCDSITDGDHQSPPKAAAGVPFITISAMNDGRIDLSRATRFVPPDYFASLKDTRRPRTGDVLYSVTGSFGISALVRTDEPFVFQRHIAILRPAPHRCDPEWLAYALAAPQVRAQAEEIATGTAQMTVPLKGLRAFSLPRLGMAEQRKQVVYLDAAFARADRLEDEAARARTLLDRLEAAILTKAFRGELVPQDPNDEPASVLLDRIRAERAAAPKPKRGRARKAVG